MSALLARAAAAGLPRLAALLAAARLPGLAAAPQQRCVTSLIDTKGRRIDKLLIANRGEIACRIIRTARRLGIKTVAVYSEADKYALHVARADEAVCVGPAPALQSYLNIDAIVDAAHKTGARAVHPGYGFLSENAAFVDRLGDEGLIFVGPPAAAIRALGDKVESKRIAAAAGLSIIPGHIGAVEDPDHAAAVAAAIGYPVMVKASAGGGGKGMRVAWNETELREAVPLAKAEAMASFGDDTLLVEKYVAGARHIEFQVVGDHFGHLVWLPERDCSIQRRNQKVIEESPSPFITPEVRAAMGAQAVALAAAVGYNSTGTVEFVVDRDSKFYFLEMNTRLQVEHPVTEAVTGLDLVHLMLAIAANQRLNVTQERAAAINGHAVEARVYAEDPGRNFAPSPGLLKVYREPSGPGVRVDSGVSEGCDVPLHYDPMLAKLIAAGADRRQALSRMEDALDRFVVRGVVTNMPHVRSCLAHPAFQSGGYDTSFIPTYYGGDNGLNPLAFPLTERQQSDLFAAAVFTHVHRALRFDPGFLGLDQKARLTLTWRDVHNSRLVPLEVLVRPAGLQMVGREGVDAGALEVQLPGHVAYVWARRGDAAGGRGREPYCTFLRHMVVDGRAITLQVARFIPRGVVLQYLGAQRELYVESPAAAALARHMPPPHVSGASRVVRAPMTGTLVEVLVQRGAEVRAGDDLAVIEAMKMRNAIKAARTGIVHEVLAEAGQVVTADQPLLKFWPSPCAPIVTLLRQAAAMKHRRAALAGLLLLFAASATAGRDGAAPRAAQPAERRGGTGGSSAGDAAGLPPALKDLITRLPKAELHIHIEGTLEPELMFDLAARNNVTLPYADVAEARAARSNFKDLADFIAAYRAAMAVLLTRQDFEARARARDRARAVAAARPRCGAPRAARRARLSGRRRRAQDLAAAYLERAAANNVTHAEIFVDVQNHVSRGVPAATVFGGLQAAIDARRAHPTAPVDAALILCIARDLGEADAAATLARSLPYVPRLAAIGLASTELGYPPSMFKRVYATAGLLGLNKVAHAGEEGGPDYVWSALRDLRVARVDHGIRSIEDPALVAYMAAARTPITLCPLSNLRLKVYAGQLEAKLREVLGSGLFVTINSDDPAFFGGYVNANYAYIAGVAGLGADELARLARNSFTASFIPGGAKLAALAAVRDALAAWRAEQPSGASPAPAPALVAQL
ncbi:Pcca [Scenedesmus sp. PABB004]|nr:Pcca [Scenedesmus sp. PABB004]